jgi:hypothetical protein
MKRPANPLVIQRSVQPAVKRPAVAGSLTLSKKGSSTAELTITRNTLDDAIKAHYADANRKELLGLLKALGVVVK